MARIYINMPDDLLKTIDSMRRTPKGEIPRSDFIISLIRLALQANQHQEVKQVG